MTSLFAGRNARASTPSAPVPSLALNLQTSVQGRPRSILWGTTVIAGNIIDVQDFAPHLVVGGQSPSGGKGGVFRGAQSAAPPNYSWDYFAAVMISLCEGPIASVDRFSGDGLTLSTYGNGTGGGTVFTGTQTQTAWSYMASLHPDHALAYRGEAYIAYGPMYLGTSTSIPSFQFEVTSAIHGAGSDFPLDANPADVLADFLTNAQYGVPGFTGGLVGDLTNYRNYCQASGLVVSPALTDQVEAGQFIRDLTQATNSEILWSGGVLSVVPYGDSDVSAHGASFVANDTPIYDLSIDDFLPLQGGDANAGDNVPIGITQRDAFDLKNIVQLTYLDRSNIYTETPIDHKDEASIADSMPRPTDVRTSKMFCLTSAASMSAALQLAREQVQNTYYFTLPRSFIRLDPMDLVGLPLDDWDLADSVQIVRIKEITENDDESLTFTAEDFLGNATAPIYDRQAISHGVPDFNVDPGDINPPLLFEMPAAADPTASTAMLYAAVSGGAHYGGADVYSSTDGVNYVLAEQIKGNARMGVTTALLPAIAGVGSADLVDIGDTLSVDLTESRGTLGSGTIPDMLNRATLCYVGGELVAYELATLTAPHKYDLTPLLRGAYGSPIAAHASGAPFVRVDGNIVGVPFEKARAGTIVYLKFVPFNVYGGGQKSLVDATAYTYRLAGTALQPEDTTNFSLDDAVVSDFVGAVNAHKEAVAALKVGAVAKAGVIATQTTLADLQGAFASFAQGTYAQFGLGAAATVAEQTSRVTADLASANTNLSTVAAFGAADFDAANKDFIDAVNSAAADRSNFKSAAVAIAGVKINQDAIASQFQSIASLSTTVFAQFGDHQAQITTNATAIATAQGSIASLSTTVTAQGVSISANTASIITNATAISSLNSSFSSLSTSVTAQFASVNSSVATNATAIASANSSIASLSTTVSSQGASITSNTAAISTANGNIASLSTTVTAQGVSITSNTSAISTINGNLSGRYTLDIDVNGKIAGFSLINGGASSTFDIRADKFNIWATGYSNTPVFSVSTIGGVAAVTINGNRLGDLSVLNNGLANNAVTNQGLSSGSGNSGTITFPVRAGSTVRVTAWMNAKASPPGTSVAGPPSLKITVNGSVVVDFPLIADASGAYFVYPSSAIYVASVGSAGTWTASALARYFSNTTGNANEPLVVTCFISVEEVNK